ncbi:EscU/YscU/HrcU family type III secretion system export apparatus switch protein [Buchnera aphidicola]|uniref:EscU/YscU/HrcU family type III secretion system export apparatus switch protein n=1 Tax=Buchnera aphidicola TaxID=9 RepID=UPI0030EBFA9D
MSCDDEKTESPTRKKIKLSKDRGINRNFKDFCSFIIVFCSFLTIFFFKSKIFNIFFFLIIFSFNFNSEIINNNNFLFKYFFILKKIFLLFFLIMTLIFIFCIIPYILFNNRLFNFRNFIMDLNRLNPLLKFKKDFYKNILTEVFKILLQLFLFFIIFIFLLKRLFLKSLNLIQNFSNYNILYSIDLLFYYFFLFILFFFPVVLIDIFIQFYRYKNLLKMTKQELKDELKNSEKNFYLSSRIKKRQSHMISKKIKLKILNSDIIITDIKNYLVSLKYNIKTMKSPQIIYSIKGFLVNEIYFFGKKNNIFIFKSLKLSKILFQTSQTNKDIPKFLYRKIAKIFICSWKSKHKKNI